MRANNPVLKGPSAYIDVVHPLKSLDLRLRARPEIPSTRTDHRQLILWRAQVMVQQSVEKGDLVTGRGACGKDLPSERNLVDGFHDRLSRASAPAASSGSREVSLDTGPSGKLPRGRQSVLDLVYTAGRLAIQRIPPKSPWRVTERSAPRALRPWRPTPADSWVNCCGRNGRHRGK